MASLVSSISANMAPLKRAPSQMTEMQTEVLDHSEINEGVVYMEGGIGRQ